MITERFAPSPTGPLHLGHAYSAWTAWQAAKENGGRFLLRMEDLDRSRVRPEFYRGIEEDLTWLGLTWDGPVLNQSDRVAAYQAALQHLNKAGLTYRCGCTRRDVAQAISAPQEGSSGAGHGPDGPVYPGTCRNKNIDRDAPYATRLNIAAALRAVPSTDPMVFNEIGAGPDGQTGAIAVNAAQMITEVGDVVLSRRDGAIAYHLAVVVDDAKQGVTHVTRGCDLFAATPIHRLLQKLLDLPVPIYRHHPLVRDDNGRRLAKRDDARAIAAYREAGLSAEQVIEHACAGAEIAPLTR